MNKYVIGILAFLGLAIVLIVLLVTGGGHKATPTVTPPNLQSYANTDAYVQLFIDGPIVAPEDHNALSITVNQYSISFALYQGYQGNVINYQLYNNDENSFQNFLASLYYAGFMDGRTVPYANNLGLCATGDKYDLYLNYDGQTIEHYWTTSCSNIISSYTGNMAATLDLFNAQIPNIKTITQTANF
jgi:hypothetical protein